MFEHENLDMNTLLEDLIENEPKLRDAVLPILRGSWELPNLDISQRQITRAFVYLCSIIFYDQFHYPQPQKGVYDIANNPFEKLKWLYRYWFNQLEVAEKDSGIEQYLRDTVLDFSLPSGFEASNTATLSCGGDLLAVDAITPDNTPYLFDGIKDYYFDADIVCANLESTVYADAPYGRNQVPGEPAKMNTNEEMLERFLDGGNGINYLCTANNHAFDYGKVGLEATLEVLDRKKEAYGIHYSGTNHSQAEQDSVLLIEKNGIKVAMLAYTFDNNGNIVPDDEKFLINEVRFNDEVCDIAMVENHVQKAKEAGADIIMANCHWGWEFEMYPHQNIIDVGHRLIEAGVNVILGGHPHVSQPMERYIYTKDGVEKTGFIVYGHGDFVSYHPESRNSKISYITKFDIVKGTLGDETITTITNLKMLPVYMLNEPLGGDNEFNCRLLRFKKVLADYGESGVYEYNLPAKDRAQLPHLNEVVLHKILLPEQQEGLIAD